MKHLYTRVLQCSPSPRPPIQVCSYQATQPGILKRYRTACVQKKHNSSYIKNKAKRGYFSTVGLYGTHTYSSFGILGLKHIITPAVHEPVPVARRGLWSLPTPVSTSTNSSRAGRPLLHPGIVTTKEQRNIYSYSILDNQKQLFSLQKGCSSRLIPKTFATTLSACNPSKSRAAPLLVTTDIRVFSVSRGPDPTDAASRHWS